MIAENLKKAVIIAATTGKLSPSDSKSDDTAMIIQNAIKNLPRRNLLKLDKISNNTNSETGESLPSGWARVPIGQIALIGSGHTPKSNANNGESVPFFRVSTMNEPGNEEYLNRSETSVQIDPKKIIPYPSVAFPKNGGALFTNKRRMINKPLLVDLNTGYIKPLGWNNKYLYYWLQSLDFKTISTGSALPTVNATAISNIIFNLPPRDEQERLVKLLDKILPLIDQLAELEREREHLDDQFVDALPSSLLLNFTTPSSKDKHEDWSKVTLAELGKVIGGGTPKSSTTEYWGGDVLWVTPADMNFTGKYIEGGRRTLTSSGLANCSARVMKAGSLVISSRAPIGYVKVTAQPLATNQGCKSIELHDVDMSDYLYYSMSAQAPRLASLGTGTTFKEVSGRTVGNFEIDLPPADVRASAVEALDKLMPLVETINKLKA